MSTPSETMWFLSAESADDLIAQLNARAESLDHGPGPAGFPATLPGGGPFRLAMINPDARKVQLATRVIGKGKSWRGRSDLWCTPEGVATGGGKVAFVFPGVEPTFGADQTDLPELAALLGLEAPIVTEETIAHRGRAVVVLGMFMNYALRRLGITPDHVAGHSLGEWSASAAAGFIGAPAPEKLLGDLDLNSVELPDVGFAALGSGADKAMAALAGWDDIELALDNCPRQSVICGPRARLRDALVHLRDHQVMGFELDFKSGFHTSALAPYMERVRGDLAKIPFQGGHTPFWSATTVEQYPRTRDEIVELYVRHLLEPVRFREVTERLYAEGVRVFVQGGIGSLTGFIDDTLGDAPYLAVETLTAKRSALAQMRRVLAALWVEGVAMDPSLLATDAAPKAETTAPAPAPKPVPTETAPATTAAVIPLRRPEPAPRPAVTRPEPSPARSRPAAATAPALAPEPVAVPAPAAVAATMPGLTPAARVALAEATAMIAHAAQANRQVLDAWAMRLGQPVPVATPMMATPATAPLAAAPPAMAPAAVSPVPVETPPVAAPPASAWPTGTVKFVRRVSLDTMPETIDHTLFRQNDDCSDVWDRFPIVAMTSQFEILMDVAREFGDGRDVIGLSNVRNFTWMDISDPLDLEITVTPVGDDTLRISLGKFCKGNVHLGTFPSPWRYEAPPLKHPRMPAHDGETLFTERLMFHGPQFQGISAMGPIGDDGIYGEFENLPAPGSLLDNVGKLIAYCAMDHQGWGEGPLPLGVEKVEFYGPLLPDGVAVHCDVRIADLQRDVIKAHGTLVGPDGNVWCHIEGWSSHIFHLDDVLLPAHRFPDTSPLSEVTADGLVAVVERWPSGALRDLMSRRFVRRADREIYDGLNLIEKRRWVVAKVGAIEASRRWLKAEYGVDVYNAEIDLAPAGEGQYRLSTGYSGERDVRVAVSTVDWLALSVYAEGRTVGIEARVVPDGDDPEPIVAELRSLVEQRCPGDAVSTVVLSTESWSTVTAERIVVAWTPV